MRRARPGAARAAAATITLAALAACSLAPDYAPPAVPAAAAFKEAQGWAAATPLDTAPRGAWWEGFGDPVLTGLETRAEAASPTIAAAIARYDQALAIADRADAERLPTVSAGADLSRERASSRRPLARGNGGTYTNRTLGGSFGWEVDLWGRLRDNARAGRADAAASAADLASARLSLHAAVADTYFRLRGLDAEAELLRQTTAAYARAFELTDIRHSGGIASGLDTSRAQSQLSDARAQLATVALDRATAEHQLAALVGEAPAGFAIVPVTGQLEPPRVPAGTPSQLLQRRPDIAAAERRMFAANARIGGAKAAWFPLVTLGASGGYQSAGGGLLASAASYWALGPLSLAAPLFDGGRRNADIRRARADFAEAAADYRGTVLTAFREVEDGLAAARHLADAEREQQTAARAAAKTTDLALIRYRDGASDYLEVVVAQTAGLIAERSALALRTQRLQATTAIVRAIGGGAPA
ncbi:efflux transporter outer membrane subunit [Sphingomonas profundi]|uniref:efflux transporter outer membrane subunit n=1 Tax=Alterirhizorhabdus profundi TaxID=2681549 RepID=UPI0012E8C0C7|nr:efflux transporter outer membrane subunit [Sphingomonas profundi]